MCIILIKDAVMIITAENIDNHSDCTKSCNHNMSFHVVFYFKSFNHCQKFTGYTIKSIPIYNTIFMVKSQVDTTLISWYSSSTLYRVLTTNYPFGITSSLGPAGRR
jgi:hypothetical protein